MRNETVKFINTALYAARLTWLQKIDYIDGKSKFISRVTETTMES